MTDNITLPRAVVEQARKALFSGKKLFAALDALDAALAEPERYPEKGPALTVYAATDDPGSPLERLRFFCSLAMRPQDWLDVAPFFAALAEPEKGNCADGSCNCCWTDKPDAKREPVHPGYIIGAHWLETAYSRIAAGEAEADVLAEVLGERGWVKPDAKRDFATKEQVIKAFEDTPNDLLSRWSYYYEAWRAAERFHGIGGSK
jgi:hypothetical protein